MGKPAQCAQHEKKGEQETEKLHGYERFTGGYENRNRPVFIAAYKSYVSVHFLGLVASLPLHINNSSKEKVLPFPSHACSF